MNKILKPKRTQVLPASDKIIIPDVAMHEMRAAINGVHFKELISNVLAITVARYPHRDMHKHIQDSNLSARDGVNQFLADLFEEINSPSKDVETEQYQ